MFLIQDFSLTKLSVSDYPEAIRLIRYVWQEMPDKSWFAVDEPGYLEQIFRQEKTKVYAARNTAGCLAGVLVLVAPEAPDDYLMCQLPPDSTLTTADVSYVDIVAVHPDLRGHRLLQRLLEFAFGKESGSHIRCFLCTVHPDNIYCRRVLERQGFRKICEITAYGGWPRLVYQRAADAFLV